jgi:hypothetical protein
MIVGGNQIEADDLCLWWELDQRAKQIDSSANDDDMMTHSVANNGAWSGMTIV